MCVVAQFSQHPAVRSLISALRELEVHGAISDSSHLRTEDK